MKLPKIKVYMREYTEAYPTKYSLSTLNVYGESYSSYYTSRKYISNIVRDLMKEQACFYASIKEPIWKLIKYIEENPEHVTYTDSIEVIDNRLSDCIEMKRNVKQLVINNQNIDLNCFDKNELYLIMRVVFEADSINKEKEKQKTRSDISDLVDVWNNDNE